MSVFGDKPQAHVDPVDAGNPITDRPAVIPGLTYSDMTRWGSLSLKQQNVIMSAPREKRRLLMVSMISKASAPIRTPATKEPKSPGVTVAPTDVDQKKKSDVPWNYIIGALFIGLIAYAWGEKK